MSDNNDQFILVPRIPTLAKINEVIPATCPGCDAPRTDFLTDIKVVCDPDDLAGLIGEPADTSPLIYCPACEEIIYDGDEDPASRIETTDFMAVIDAALGFTGKPDDSADESTETNEA